jgi:hypothetical protein
MVVDAVRVKDPIEDRLSRRGRTFSVHPAAFHSGRDLQQEYNSWARKSSWIWAHTYACIDLCTSYMLVWYNMGMMKRTALYLKTEQIKRLERLSERTGAPVAELVRRAIDYYLKRRQGRS